MELTDASIDATKGRNCRIGKTTTNKMVFSTEDRVLIAVLRQEKGYDS